MTGFISRMYSPSIVHIRRSTPWVAGWCGPRLIVNSSFSGSSCVPKSGASTSPVAWMSSPGCDALSSSRSTDTRSSSLIPARQLVLIEGEQDRLAAHREVAPLRVALVVLGHEDPPHVGVALEDDAEHVVDLALLKVGRRVEVDNGRHGLAVADAQLDVQPVEALHREQLVVDAEARLLRVVVVAVHAHDTLEEVVRSVAQVVQDVADRRRRDLEGGVALDEVGAHDRLVSELLPHSLCDQLEAGRVRQLPRCPRPGSERATRGRAAPGSSSAAC